MISEVMVNMVSIIKRVTVEIDPNTLKRFQEKCIDLDMTISDMIKYFIENLQEHESN